MPMVLVGGIPVQIDDYGNPVGGGPVAPAGQTLDPYAAPPPMDPYAAPAPAAPPVDGTGELRPDGTGGVISGGPPQPSVTADKVGERGSVSTSQTAMNDERLAKNRQGYQQVMSREDAITAEEMQRGAGQAQGHVAASQAAEAATAEAAEAQAGKFDAKAEGDRQLAALNERFALANEAGHKEAQSVALKYRADLEQALAEYRAADVNPNALWQSMEGVEKGATLAGAFLDGFLGAKGIKTNAMAMFDRAVERNIAAQVENIRKKGQVAEHFKALWEMAMQEGQTEAEARQRIHAFHLAGAEKQIAAEVAKYDSDLARANGAAAIATLRDNLTTRLNDIQDKAYNRAQHRIQQALDTEHRSQQLAIQKSQNALGWANYRENKRQFNEQMDAKKAAAAGQMPETMKLVIKNPLTGKAEAVATSDEGWKRVTEVSQFVAEYKEALDEYLRIAEEEGAVYDGPGGKYIRGTGSAKVVAAQKNLAWKYAQALSGKTMTKSEIERSDLIQPLQSLLVNSNTEEIVQQTGAEVMGRWKIATNQYTRGFDEQEAQFAPRFDTVVNQADAFQEDYRQGAHGKRITTEVDKAMQRVTSPTAREMTAADKTVVTDWETATGTEAPGDLGKIGVSGGKKVVPEYAVGMRDMFEVATSNSKSTADRQAALNALGNLAQGGDARGMDGGANYEQAALAQYYLQMAAEKLKDTDFTVPSTQQGDDLEGVAGSYSSD